MCPLYVYVYKIVDTVYLLPVYAEGKLSRSSSVWQLYRQQDNQSGKYYYFSRIVLMKICSCKYPIYIQEIIYVYILCEKWEEKKSRQISVGNVFLMSDAYKINDVHHDL